VRGVPGIGIFSHCELAEEAVNSDNANRAKPIASRFIIPSNCRRPV
jgi:hypothetical protein